MDSNFAAKVYAVIKNFERNIRKAQQLARTSVPNEISVNVTADLRKLQKKLTRAKGILTTIPPRKEINVDAKVKKAQYNIKRVTQNLYKLPSNSNINVDANVKKAQIKLKKVNHSLRTLPKKTINIDVDTTATSKMRKVIRSIESQVNHFKNNVDRLAGDIKSFGIVFSQTFKGIMLTSVQGLIPVIAGLAPALFAVLNAVKALTGGLIAITGAGSIAFGSFVAYAGLAITAIKMLEEGTIRANSATQKYQSAIKGVKNAWQGIVKQNANAIFESLANGLNTVKSALTSLTPFFKSVADGVNTASKKMLEWTENSKVAQKFFEVMNTTGVTIFNKLLSAAGRFGDGLINVFTQLVPMFQWSAEWLDRLGTSFQNWANSVNGQNSIKQFIEYTKINLPIIGDIFKNVFAGIFNLMRAFGQNSTTIFEYLEKMSAKFRSWSETVGQSEGFRKFIDYMQQNGPVIMQLIGNIVRLLVAFGTAMAPIASSILNVVNKIIDFTATLMENHPWIAKVAGIAAILLGAIWALAVPLIAINSFLGLFGTSLLNLAKSFLTSSIGSKIFTGIINILKVALRFLLSPIGNIVKILPILGTAFTALTGPVGIIIGIIAVLVGGFIYLWKTNEGFRKAITEAWQKISSAVINKVTQIYTFITSKFSALVSVIGNFVTQWIIKIVTGFSKMVSSAIQGMYNFNVKISSGFDKVISTIAQGVSNAVARARSFISEFVQTGADMIRGLISGIGNMAGQLMEAARGVARRALNAAKSALGIHSPSREFKSLGMYSMIGLANGISEYTNKAVKDTKIAATRIMDAFKVDLSDGVTEGLGASFKSNINAHMTKDVRHSMQENNKPIVNILVKNETDIPVIKTQIEELVAREGIGSDF